MDSIPKNTYRPSELTMNKGLFITFEGIEGCGKTTQLEKVYEWLQSLNFSVVKTKEPGGTKIGKKIRSLLLNPDSKDMNSLTELFLYSADRAQHIREIITPVLDKDNIVLCDRFSDATKAYQGYARKIDINLIEQLNTLATSGLKPDLTLLFDLDPETGLQRARKRNKTNDKDDMEGRFEREDLPFHRRVRRAYLKIAENNPERFKVISADNTAEEIFKNSKSILKEIIDGSELQ